MSWYDERSQSQTTILSESVWNFLGIAQRAKGLPLLAEAAHRRAIELDPKFFLAYSNLGNVFVIILIIHK